MASPTIPYYIMIPTSPYAGLVMNPVVLDQKDLGEYRWPSRFCLGRSRRIIATLVALSLDKVLRSPLTSSVFIRASAVDVYQYDVSIPPDIRRPALVKKIWIHRTTDHGKGLTHKLGETIKISVNLAKEIGCIVLRNQEAECYIVICLTS